MTHFLVTLQISARAAAAVLSVLVALAGATPVEAQGHRAKLSRDLADHLSQRATGATDVILPATEEQARTVAARYGATVKKILRHGAVLQVTGGQLDALSQDPDVAHLSGDVPVSRMSVTAEAIGADQVWSGWLPNVPGVTGRGIGVAVIDSGVALHRALKDRVIAAYDFTGPAGVGRDQYGHGTHVAGIVAGTDADYAGIAPGAHIVSLRVLGADGSGRTSDVIDAIDWAIEHRAAFGLRILNLSLGHPVLESYKDDPLCQAVQRATDAGLLVVAAAGNFGKTADGRPIVGGIVSPGNSPAALTVGAVNAKGTARRSDDVMATYSSRGPTMIDGLLKPELAAPGNRIAAAAAAGATLSRTLPDRIVGGAGAAEYIELSGTSMATAVVSGAAALLLEAEPTLTPTEIKVALQLTSSRVPGAGLIEAGAGSVNVAAAVALVEGHGPATTLIDGETVKPILTSFSTSSTELLSTGRTLVWDASATILWDEGWTIVWDAGRTIVWDAGRTIVWDAGRTIVWDTARTIVWDTTAGIDSNTIVWDATIVWDGTFVD